MKKLNNIKLSNKQQIIIIFISIFLMMLVLNFLTPILADDYSYSLALDNTKINSLMDIVDYQIWHYFNWGGRSIAHTIAQIFLLFPKWIFNIINSLAYLALVYLIYLHGRGNRKDKPLILLLIHLGLWFLLPVFGQSCLWLIGSFNYLWTTVIVLFFLWLFRKNCENPSILKIIGMFLLGMIAGWTNENTSAGLIIILICYLFIEKITNKKQKINKFQISSLIGAITGFLLMILAPGNYARTEAFQDNSFILIKIIKRTISITNCAELFILPLIILLIILISIKIYNKKKIEMDAYVFMFGGFVATYSMVLSPTFPERSWTGVIIYLIIACSILLYDLDKINRIYKYIFVDCCIVLFIIYIGQYIVLSTDINNLRNTWEYRINIINKQKKKKMITIDKYETYNIKNPAYGLSDIGADSDKWPNTSIADYYKIKSIKTDEN